MRYPLEFGQFVQFKNFIFAVTFTRHQHLLEYYDTSTDKWIKYAPFYLRGYQRIAALWYRLCVVGQYDSFHYARNKTREGDTARDVWSDIAAPKQSHCSYMINFYERLLL